MNDLVNAILEIAKKNPDGFTFSLELMKTIDSGNVVGYSATQNSFGVEGLLKCIEHAQTADNFVGGWVNLSGELQFDSCRVYPPNEVSKAKAFGIKQKQIAIFSFEFGEILL